MKSIALLVSLITSISAGTITCQWVQRELPSGRGQIYAGVRSNQAVFASSNGLIDVYDLRSDSWEVAPPLTRPRPDITALSHDDKVFFFGGSGSYAMLDQYDGYRTTALTGVGETAFHYGAVASSARYGSASIYIAPYKTDSGSSLNIWKYTYDRLTGMSATLITVAYSMSSARSFGTAISVGKYVIFAGGKENNGVPISAVNMLDTETDVWSSTFLSEARAFLASTKKGSLAFFAGGRTTATLVASNVVDIFDSTNATWNTSSLSVARYNIKAISGLYVYFAGGLLQGGQASSVIDIFDPDTYSWFQQSLSQARHNLAAVSIGGQVFFAGGFLDSSGSEPYEGLSKSSRIDIHLCQPCPAGSYFDDGICLMCEPGTYSPGSVPCEVCPRDTYSMRGASNCTFCPLRAWAEPGSSQCSVCSPGTYYTGPNSPRCTDCAAGFYSAAFSATKCRKCPSNTWSNSTGQAECSPCFGTSSKKYSCTIGTCNFDGVCDGKKESCLSCPNDCKTCSLDGWLVEFYRSYFTAPLLIDKRFSSDISFGNAVGIFNTSENGVIAFSSRFRAPKSGYYEFRVIGTLVGARLSLKNTTILNPEVFRFEEGDYQMSYFTLSDNIKMTGLVYLSADRSVDVSLQTLVDTNAMGFINPASTISVSWREKRYVSSTETELPFLPFSGTTYRREVCGDGVCDLNEICSIDCPNPNDGYCNVLAGETQKTSTDCWHLYSQECTDPSSAEILRPITPGKAVSDDTFGNLIRNQVIWRLPGIEHLEHGFHIVTGRESTSPLFQFRFCSEDSLHDQYRGNVYALPIEYTATAEPFCSFSTTSKQYTSALSYAQSLAADSSLSIGGKIGGGGWGITASISASYSQEKSVAAASEVSSEKTGLLVVTTASCLTYKASIRNFNLHPVLLEKLRKIDGVWDANVCHDLVSTYGTHYYTSAEMGGKLVQIVSTSSEDFSSSNSKELSEMSSESLSLSVGGYGVSVGVDASMKSSKKTSTEQKTKFTSNTSKSFIQTYGGPPGSFGPSTGDAPSTWGEWAGSLDLLPVPVNYKLKETYQMIADLFGAKSSVAECWKVGTISIINSNSGSTSIKVRFTTQVNNVTTGMMYIQFRGNRGGEYVTSGKYVILDENFAPSAIFSTTKGRSYEFDVRIPEFFDSITSITMEASSANWNTLTITKFQVMDFTSSMVYKFPVPNHATVACTGDGCQKYFQLATTSSNYYELTFVIPITDALRSFFNIHRDFTITAILQGERGSTPLSTQFSLCASELTNATTMTDSSNNKCFSLKDTDRLNMTASVMNYIANPLSVTFTLRSDFKDPSTTLFIPRCSIAFSPVSSIGSTRLSEVPSICYSRNLDYIDYTQGGLTNAEINGRSVTYDYPISTTATHVRIRLYINSVPSEVANISIATIPKTQNATFVIARNYTTNCQDYGYSLERRENGTAWQYYLSPSGYPECCASVLIRNIELIEGSMSGASRLFTSIDSVILNPTPSSVCSGDTSQTAVLNGLYG